MPPAPRPSEAHPSAVLFDLDGTLVDTEPHWMAAETALVEAFGGTWTHEQALTLVGLGLENSSAVLQGAGVDLPIPEIIDLLTDEVVKRLHTDLPWRPGALQLLHEVRAAGVPVALVTMSVRRMALAVAEAAGDAFDVIVSGSDVEKPKPDPEAYLAAGAALGVDLRRAIAIEDSPPGLAAAVGSGATTIGVPHMLPLPSGDGWTIWPTLEGRTLADLTALLTPGAA